MVLEYFIKVKHFKEFVPRGTQEPTMSTKALYEHPAALPGTGPFSLATLEAIRRDQEHRNATARRKTDAMLRSLETHWSYWPFLEVQS